jgi:hypothetical protein
MHAFRALSEPPGPSRPILGDRRPLAPQLVLDGVRRVSPVGWVAIDVGVLVIATGVAIAVAALISIPVTIPAVVLGMAVLIWLLVDLVRTGRTVGHRLLGQRTVDGATGFPVSPRTLATATTADIRRGRDPIRVLPRQGAAPPPQVDQWHLTASRALNAPIVLVLDNGMAYNLLGPTVIGRNPSRVDENAQLLQIADLTRTMSKSHALLEPQGGVLWVTDLGSMNGTSIATNEDDALERIDPHVRTLVRTGARLEFGDRLATIGTTARSASAREEAEA